MKVISLLALFENIAFCLCSGCHLCNMMGLVRLLGYSDDCIRCVSTEHINWLAQVSRTHFKSTYRQSAVC